ncbi:MAG TPA: methylated-DNA--[protein]-cysteine S-methyltransferase [Vicinamibacteria bacterium]|nr:methylated-DNA--[protein]-cysteine S-methyltransferase [Vicinamibacteria bacterium]
MHTERAPAAVATIRFTTPVGDLAAFTREGALCALSFADGRYDPLAFLRARFGTVHTSAEDPLDVTGRFRDYFRGQLDALDRLPVDTGGTPFQRRVWDMLRTIPAGTTLSYLEVARRVGAEDAVRAVGAANGANPVAIVIPCHRVIGADGRLVGYGGGLDRKRWLLAHEKATIRPAAAAQARLFG